MLKPAKFNRLKDEKSNSMSNRCFSSVQPKSHQDLSPLREYGELVVVFSETRYRPSFFDDDFSDIFLDEVHKLNFDPNKDFFVGIGTSLQQVVSVNALILEYGEINFLVYDPRYEKYQRIILGEPFDECESS